MAVPTPQTPSAQYDILPYSGSPVYVELKGNLFLTIKAPKSFCRIDYPLYDGGNYRDTIDSSFIGRAPQGISKIADPGITAVDIPTAGQGDILIEVTAATIIGPVPDQIATMMEEDDNFSHTPPHPELKARTMMMWFDGPIVTSAPSGSICARCWVDRYIGEGTSIPQTNGAVPPAYTPT